MKSHLPLIGITTSGQQITGSFCLRREYVEAVRCAGGIPILLPPGQPEADTILEQVDGLIFSGGGDIDPVAYNGSPHPTIYNLDSQRDASELALAQLVLGKDIPVLGICRGLEVLVVATGGSLVSHLPDEFGEAVAHRADQLHSVEHSVQITPGSLLNTIVGTTEIKVMSWHHQAANTVPLQWRITARASDGVIEALEHKSHPWAIALQWHPELSINNPQQLRIFQAFVAAASTHKVVMHQKAS